MLYFEVIVHLYGCAARSTIRKMAKAVDHQSIYEVAMSSIGSVGSSVTFTAVRAITSEDVKKATPGKIDGFHLFAISDERANPAQLTVEQEATIKASQSKIFHNRENVNEQLARIKVDLQAKKLTSGRDEPLTIEGKNGNRVS